MNFCAIVQVFKPEHLNWPVAIQIRLIWKFAQLTFICRTILEADVVPVRHESQVGSSVQ